MSRAYSVSIDFPAVWAFPDVFLQVEASEFICAAAAKRYGEDKHMEAVYNAARLHGVSRRRMKKFLNGDARKLNLYEFAYIAKEFGAYAKIVEREPDAPVVRGMRGGA